MIDQARLERIRLSPRPLGQRFFGTVFVWPSYNLRLRRTRIVLEGEEHIPREGGAILVMNHTDRYNYWPLQYAMWRRQLGYTATWVKGKYYEHPLLGWFMDVNNNIPIPSKGYVLSKDFVAASGRKPTDQEYDALKRLADGRLDEAQAIGQGGEGVELLVRRPFPEVPSGRYADSLEARFTRMMERVVEINQEALRMGLNLLIFPQGTRSVRLTRGHTGAAQVILHTGAKVIPIGCNGSEKLYPGNSPWSSGGTVTYRIGAPLTLDGELSRFRISEPFMPFTRSAEPHQPVFQALTDLLMDRINGLLDPPYQYGDVAEQVTRAGRFV